jgi:hypothetical protein
VLWGALLLAGGGAGADTEPPVAHAAPSSPSVEVGANVAFLGSAEDGGVSITNPNLYNWTFDYNGSQQRLQGQTVQFRFFVEGNYTITLAVDDAAGNRNTTSFVLTVRAKAAPPSGPPAPASTAGATPGLEAAGAVAAVAGLALLARRGRR